MTLPSFDGARHRLVIAEFEEYLVDDDRPYDRTPTQKKRRLVFVEHVELSRQVTRVTSAGRRCLGRRRTPAWSPDGKQLFFHAIARPRLAVVDIRAEQGVTSGTPVPSHR